MVHPASLGCYIAARTAAARPVPENRNGTENRRQYHQHRVFDKTRFGGMRILIEDGPAGESHDGDVASDQRTVASRSPAGAD